MLSLVIYVNYVVNDGLFILWFLYMCVNWIVFCIKYGKICCYEVVGIELSIGMVLSILVCDYVNFINGNWESVEYVLNNFDSNVGWVVLSSMM